VPAHDVTTPIDPFGQPWGVAPTHANRPGKPSTVGAGPCACPWCGHVHQPARATTGGCPYGR